VARITVEDCLEKMTNHFALVNLAAQRARQIAGGTRPLIHCDNKPAVTALREIAAGKVSFREDVEAVVRSFVSERKKLDSENRSATSLRRRRHG